MDFGPPILILHCSIIKCGHPKQPRGKALILTQTLMVVVVVVNITYVFYVWPYACEYDVILAVIISCICEVIEVMSYY
jgi:hypothetical protein